MGKNKSLININVEIPESMGEATKVLANGAVSFLGKICNLAAEEFGLFLKERVSYWRFAQAIKIADKAEKLIEKNGGLGNKSAHPRIVYEILEHGSWVDDDNLQDMWAGLLASSCTESGKDQSNLKFKNILSQLSPSEAKVINYVCKHAKKSIKKDSGPFAVLSDIDINTLKEISGLADIHEQYIELLHLRSLELLPTGLWGGSSYYTFRSFSLSALALYMYVRCQGSLKSPVEYFGIVKDKEL